MGKGKRQQKYKAAQGELQSATSNVLRSGLLRQRTGVEGRAETLSEFANASKTFNQASNKEQSLRDNKGGV
jgi:hypothetical protein